MTSGRNLLQNTLIHSFDVARDRALVIRLSSEKIREAAFLDDRILSGDVQGAWAAWREIEEAAARYAPSNPSFIFHMGHCGSTLLSRLIEAATDVRSLREPSVLRVLASLAIDADEGLCVWSAGELSRRLEIFLRIASADQPCVIKATSWCGALSLMTSGPAIFCYSKPDIYFATMLGAENNFVDLKSSAAGRLRRLRHLLGAEVATIALLSLGELAAMNWAAETVTINIAAERAPGRFHFIEFDKFLADPQTGLASAIAHLGLSAAPDRIGAALSSPLMRTYSKDASFDFSPADRHALISEFKKAQSGEIQKGLDWLARAGEAHPEIAAAVRRFS